VGRQLVSDEEVKNFISALLEANPDGLLQDEIERQAEKFIEWVEKVRLDNALLSLVLSRRVNCRFNADGELTLHSAE